MPSWSVPKSSRTASFLPAEFAPPVAFSSPTVPPPPFAWAVPAVAAEAARPAAAAAVITVRLLVLRLLVLICGSIG
ncbi:hypothetical protein Shyhy02_70780 [Streptomyces hygroscopicus subsp. hygroscopicus]|nr:hypothetical protein Shyhy02_70780 [Streptomyces hygroscopicus subsp. hygroscopicus]